MLKIFTKNVNKSIFDCIHRYMYLVGYKSVYGNQDDLLNVNQIYPKCLISTILSVSYLPHHYLTYR